MTGVWKIAGILQTVCSAVEVKSVLELYILFQHSKLFCFFLLNSTDFLHLNKGGKFLTLEKSALKLFMVAYLRYQLS